MDGVLPDYIAVCSPAGGSIDAGQTVNAM